MPTLWEQSVFWRETQDQTRSSVAHFFCKASLSEMSTDTFDGNHVAKIRLCCEGIFRHLIRHKSRQRGVWPPRQGRSEVVILWDMWLWEGSHSNWIPYWEHLQLHCLFCFYSKYGKLFGWQIGSWKEGQWVWLGGWKQSYMRKLRTNKI